MNFTIYIKILECFYKRKPQTPLLLLVFFISVSFRQKSAKLLRGSNNGQDISVGWAMLLMPPSDYMG